MQELKRPATPIITPEISKPAMVGLWMKAWLPDFGDNDTQAGLGVPK